MSVRLYVGNLPFSVSEQDLEELFGQIGVVESANLVTDRDTGRSRGFAFVEMDSREAADAAIAELNGREIEGRALTVNEARPRENRGPRGGGFGGGRGFGGGGGGGRGGGGFNRDRGGRGNRY
ncbi:MAG: RNA-binding protein [Acidobacteria bacterium]|nr:RNA-binding protein [Acidobacteriota bacterium]